MKKKGFTLVELLAVIAILAILVIIALPNVLSMFNNAKKNAFKTEVLTIYKQAGTDFISDSLKESGPRFYCDTPQGNMDGSSPSDCKNLNLTTTKKYYVEMDSSGNVTYIGVQDNSFSYGSNDVTSENDVADNDILDTSKNDDFNVYDKNVSEDGVHEGDSTDNRANYTVVHLQQKIIDIPSGHEEDDNYYNVIDTNTYSAPIGNTVTPATRSYTGFTSPSTKSVVVNSNGSTVIKYYYTRNKNTLNVTGTPCDGINTTYQFENINGGIDTWSNVAGCVSGQTTLNYSYNFYYNQYVTVTLGNNTQIYHDGVLLGTKSVSFNMPASNYQLTYIEP